MMYLVTQDVKTSRDLFCSNHTISCIHDTIRSYLKPRSAQGRSFHVHECGTLNIFLRLQLTVEISFSDSLMIHKEKTKEITTVTVVWIPGLSQHKILRAFALNFSKNYEWFEKPYQKLERVFHQVSKHLEVGQKNSAAPRFFNPLLGVWIS